jgi:hypothetical protein
MPRSPTRRPYDNPDDDPDDVADHDGDDNDFDALDPEDDDIDLRTCAECGRDVVADAIACPYCGFYLEPDAREFGNGRPWWVVLGVLLCLLMILSCFFRLM